ncbi:MAG: HAMP domain-containing sensor histidine kinase, partial [Kiritimatiellaeota bacterium]|nr:HAMP domain-containing sensor histidine kinase [Kiritimatiellota bacterium]
QLHEALRLKTEFLNIAAHDLKNPLTGILGFSELLTQPDVHQKPADVVEMAQAINQSAHRMLYLIRNLLDVSRYESRQFQPNPVALDLVVVTQRLVSQNSARAAQKNITLHNEITGAAPAWADQTLTEQVMDNLLSNAIKFSPPGKSVFVRSRTEADSVLWEVQDQGPGLSAADKAKLFQKFSRLSARPTGGENSTGLGLSIVKLLVASMGGRVWCESELGRGATFIVALPQPKPTGVSSTVNAGSNA